MKLEPTATSAIFNSNIPGEEFLLKTLNKENAQKVKFADKPTLNQFNNKWSKKRNHDGEDND